MPSKPKDNLNPQKPGVPLSQAELHKRSTAFQKAQAQKLKEQGIEPGPLQGSLEDLPPQHPEEPKVPPAAEPPPRQQTAGPPIPAMFDPEDDGPPEKQHPLLDTLETEFGISKLEVEHVDFAGHLWSFRPSIWQYWEWIAINQVNETKPGLTITNVAAHLAAIDMVPVYEIFGVNTTGRHIPDKMNPPPKIRILASDLLLEWLRFKVGLWEIIDKLDQHFTTLFEKRRRDTYPLWEELVNLERKKLVLMQDQSKKPSKTTPSGNSGDEPSPTPTSSQQTQEPLTSGTNPSPVNGSSTGTTEQNASASTV